jgi:hypothetical protein
MRPISSGSVDFRCELLSPLIGFDRLGGLFDREQYLKTFLLGAIFKRAVYHGCIDAAPCTFPSRCRRPPLFPRSLHCRLNRVQSCHSLNLGLEGVNAKAFTRRPVTKALEILDRMRKGEVNDNSDGYLPR